MILSKLNRYVGALAVVGAAATSANAAVVWSGPVNINIPSTTSGVYLNVVSGATGTSSSLPGWDINPWSSTGLNLFSSTTQGGVPGATAHVGSGTNVTNLAAGTPIGPASVFATSTTPAFAGANLNSSNNIVGFRFVNEANGNQQHFGWIRISLSGTTSAQPRAIVEYAYESVAGAPINAGDIPTPGAASLLGLGALAGLRRRR